MALSIEDIMCDQKIFCNDFNKINTIDSSSQNHHLFNSYSTISLRNIRLQTVIKNLKDHFASFITNNFAILQRIPSLSQSSLPSTPAPYNEINNKKRIIDKNAEVPERCVECMVLYEPSPERHIGDIVFIHGLHGGLDRTWKQGTWCQGNNKIKNLIPNRNKTVPLNSASKENSPEGTLWKIYSKVRRKHNNNNTDEEYRNETDIYQKPVEKTSSTNENLNNANDNISQCWPQDWLPHDCPGMRVLAINYTTDVLWRPLWQKRRTRSDLKERSKEMIEQLLELNLGNKPIVWVGHSKGGLFIKQILLDAWNANDAVQSRLKNMFTETKGIMFYSVPHKGSPIADIIFPFFKRSIELLEVQRNCEFVLNLHKQFLDIFNDTTNNNNNSKPEIFSFIDTENTPVAFTSFQFIAYESADPDIGIKCTVPLNHRDICKPAGRDCFLYLELVKLIKRTVKVENNSHQT